MTTVERYDVCVNGTPTDAVALRRLGALAFAHELLRAAPQRLTSISIFEHVTGEPRACWFRESGGWQAVSVAEWLS